MQDIRRPTIPNELRRRVLVEAGHRCAIPTCRYIEVDIHHIIPWAQCGAHEYENLIALCPNCHRRADNDDIDRKSLRLYKYNLRFAHDKFTNTEMDVLFLLLELGDARSIQWPAFNLILLRRIIDAGLIAVRPSGSVIAMNGMRFSPDDLFLTRKGQQFLEELGSQEL
jgi:hypothetical protein